MGSMESMECSIKKRGFSKTALETVTYAQQLSTFARVAGLTGRQAQFPIFLKTTNASKIANQDFSEMVHTNVKHASTLALSALLEQTFALCVISRMQNLSRIR